jgi:hypothetical protein
MILAHQVEIRFPFPSKSAVFIMPTHQFLRDLQVAFFSFIMLYSCWATYLTRRLGEWDPPVSKIEHRLWEDSRGGSGKSLWLGLRRGKTLFPQSKWTI